MCQNVLRFLRTLLIFLLSCFTFDVGDKPGLIQPMKRGRQGLHLFCSVPPRNLAKWKKTRQTRQKSHGSACFALPAGCWYLTSLGFLKEGNGSTGYFLSSSALYNWPWQELYLLFCNRILDVFDLEEWFAVISILMAICPPSLSFMEGTIFEK